jgi:hypothetical protein
VCACAFVVGGVCAALKVVTLRVGVCIVVLLLVVLVVLVVLALPRTPC